MAFADIDPALQGTYWTARDKGGSFMTLAFTGSKVIWGGSFGEQFYDEFVDGLAGKNDSEYAWIADDGLTALRFAGDFLYKEKIVELFSYELDGKKLVITWVAGDEAGQSLTLVRLGGGAVPGGDISNSDTAAGVDSALAGTSRAYDQFDSIIRTTVDSTPDGAMWSGPLGDMPKMTGFTLQQ